MAPTSQSGKRSLKSRSLARETSTLLVSLANAARLTCLDAGRTAMQSSPSLFSMTVLASSFPEICAHAAIPWDVYALLWVITMYLTWFSSRNGLSFWMGIEPPAVRGYGMREVRTEDAPGSRSRYMVPPRSSSFRRRLAFYIYSQTDSRILKP